MATYCLLLLVQDYRYQMVDKMWPFVLAPLALFLIQLAYPTLLGRLLSVAFLAALGAMFLTDPFYNLGPGREFVFVGSWMFCGFVYRRRPRQVMPPEEGGVEAKISHIEVFSKLGRRGGQFHIDIPWSETLSQYPLLQSCF
jgi:hypothetical protein